VSAGATPTVGVVSLGAMGSAMAHALTVGGARVVATVSGRSERTRRLADRSGAELLPDLAAVIREAEVVLSIVPPESAVSVAVELATATVEQSAAGPRIVELNAIAPGTAQWIESELAARGLELVDGSISGPPPWKPGTTRVYLSGPRADEVAALPFDGVERIVVGSMVGAASAVKMSTASVYKGSTAVLAQALLAAERNGVLDHVLADLREGAPELVARIERRLAIAASKSGRYVGEMREIAAAQEAAGLTPSLFEAMAEVYTDLAASSLAAAAPEELAADLDLRAVLGEMR
jgi:3-hydroxyisobutyrate dehydrogenase-like beta-hydroxyacid dehydrogenase